MGIKRVRLPDLGEGVTEGEIIKIKVAQGDRISMDQVLIEVMTDKASMEVPSSIEGVIKNIEIKEGDIVSVGASLFTVQTEGDTGNEEIKPEFSPEKSQAPQRLDNENTRSKKDLQSPEGRFLASPATRKLALELELPLESIHGTGPKGEIKRVDLINYVKSYIHKSPQAPAPPSKITPKTSEFKETKRKALRGVKRLMFESMTLSKATIPHFTIGERSCVKHLLKLKEEMRPQLEKKGLKAGWLAFFIKTLIPVLKEFPIFNIYYDQKTKEIVFGENFNIGFAVDSPQGLLVPVLKQSQDKSLLEIIGDIQHLANMVRKGSIERDDLTGATITLSNLGALGGLYGTPIINPPEMAIMGIYSLFKDLIQNPAGEVEEQAFINFSITCDHRFIDGATAARFLKSFTQKIEEPSLLLLE